MESAEPLERMYELCDDAFYQGTFIHEWIYDLSYNLVWYYNMSARNGHRKNNLGNSSEPPNDDAQSSPPKRSRFNSVN